MSRSTRFVRIFLLSPALLTGARGRRLIAGEGPAHLVAALAEGGRVPLGDVHAFISSLYFRGKRAYALRFGHRAHGPCALVITPDRGLVPVDQPVDREALVAMAAVAVDPEEPRYTRPLLDSARGIRAGIGDEGRVVLLGSLATTKYLEPLGTAFGDRLEVPEAFVGLGDMQRGSLLLRAVEAGRELAYVPADGLDGGGGEGAGRRRGSRQGGRG
ncbi:MAG TPA: hypothetical protein VK858_10375 [Longimicrobiales bacterium]|nr:hypothetical protein [Longimicrobiales bacterium]